MNLLYKYDNRLDALDELINKKLLSFSSPSTFNDPFDCKVHYSLDVKHLSSPSYRASAEFLIQRDLTRLHQEGLFLEFNSAQELIDGNQLERIRENVQQRVRSNTRVHGIYCLSETPTNILMWSHYAEKHKGFCIEFETERLRSSLYDLFRITYSTSVPTIDMFSTLPDDYIMPFLTKSVDWIYEKEWRLIYPNFMGQEANYKLHQLDVCPVTRVLVGSKCELKNEIIEICIPKNIPVIELSEQEAAYKLI